MKIYFGENLKYLRKQKGWKQEDMELIAGFKRSTWGSYETNDSYPNFMDLIKIAGLFGVSETDLIHSNLSNLKTYTSVDNGINVAAEPDQYYATNKILSELEKINKRLEGLEKARPNTKRNSA